MFRKVACILRAVWMQTAWEPLLLAPIPRNQCIPNWLPEILLFPTLNIALWGYLNHHSWYVRLTQKYIKFWLAYSTGILYVFSQVWKHKILSQVIFQSFQMFAGPLFQMILHLQHTVLFRGFQSSPWAWSKFHGSGRQSKWNCFQDRARFHTGLPDWPKPRMMCRWP